MRWLRRPPRGGRGSQQQPETRVRPPPRVAPREGGVDRNTPGPPTSPPRLGGRPPRGGRGSQLQRGVGRLGGADRVAPREGGVDRNGKLLQMSTSCGAVAPREGGVDRNSGSAARRKSTAAEGRPPRGGRGSQLPAVNAGIGRRGSPPARGAWIATCSGPCGSGCRGRRPPRGGRGSQLGDPGDRGGVRGSPPARGAWIATATPLATAT